MKFEEILPALREGKKIRLKGCKEFEYLFKPKNENELRTEDYQHINLSWEDLLADDWEIVKEPKKVKLRDLTRQQYRAFLYGRCGNQRVGIGCVDCPFYNVSCIYGEDNKCWIDNKDLYSDKFLDQEIEVEEWIKNTSLVLVLEKIV